MLRSKPSSAEPTVEPQPDGPLPDAVTQIQEAKDRIVHAVIKKAIDDGSYQHAKWLFEFGGITSAGHNSPEDQIALLRLLVDQVQIPESPEEIATEFSANVVP